MPRLAPVTRMTAAGTLRRIDRPGQFVAHLDLGAVGIGREQIRLARHELALFAAHLINRIRYSSSIAPTVATTIDPIRLYEPRPSRPNTSPPSSDPTSPRMRSPTSPKPLPRMIFPARKPARMPIRI